jgi:hypothetical protein
MAVYIEIRKVEESATEAVYEYTPATGEGDAGRLVIDKRSGVVTKAGADRVWDPHPDFARAARKIFQHHRNGEYPEHTCWAS